MTISAPLAFLLVCGLAACGSSPDATSATSEAAYTSLDRVPPIGSFYVNGAEKLDVYEAVDSGPFQDVTSVRVGRHYWQERAYGVEVSQGGDGTLGVKLTPPARTALEGVLTWDESWVPASAWAGTLGTDEDRYIVRVSASDVDDRGRISAVTLSVVHQTTTERTETQTVQATNGRSYTTTALIRELDVVTFVTGAKGGYHPFEN